MRSVLISMLGAWLVLLAAGPLTGKTAWAAGDMPPGTITLDSLSQLFQGVEFDHDMHASKE